MLQSKIAVIPEERCPNCRRTKFLSGELRCALHVKLASLTKRWADLDKEHLEGSSPPGVFVGRFGYPNVSIGPMVPPVEGNTEILDTPEWWIGKDFSHIVDYRHSLVRGYRRANVLDARAGGRLVESLQEAAMATKPMDAELVLAKKPKKIFDLREDSQPFGPMAPLTSFKASNISVDRRIEKAFHDPDLKANDAVNKLYSDGVFVTRIQRAFSVGMVGEGKRRKFVPTRWSITAVDSMLGLRLIDSVRHYPTLDEYRVYKYEYLDNIYIGILTPEEWKFEWIEAWFEPELLAMGFPETDFVNDVQTSSYLSPEGYRPVLLGDWEGYYGRKSYAKPGGCYYASRFSVLEYLDKIRRQAGAIMLREIHPGYIMPVGVWNVRESIRALLRSQYARFDTLDSALNYACTILEIPKKSWIEGSALLHQGYFQRKLTEFS